MTNRKYKAIRKGASSGVICFQMLEQLESRILLSGVEWLPGMFRPQSLLEDSAGQVIYLDYDGTENLTFNGPVKVEGIDIPVFSAESTAFVGHEAELTAYITREIANILSPLDLFVTAELPRVSEYSTIYIGGTDDAFAEYGDFWGLAENVDKGNSDRTDSGFVFSDMILTNGSVSVLIDVAVHEITHLLGCEHRDERMVSESGALANVAHLTGVHEYIAEEASDLYRALFGVSGVTLEHQSYLSTSTTSSVDSGNCITEGVVEEDGGVRWLDHFSNGGDGDELFDGLSLGGTINTPYESADDTRYPNAVSSYNGSDKAMGYWWLGRAMHLLQDSTVPAHVHKDAHTGSIFDGDDEYEERAGNYTANFDFDIYQNGTSWEFQNWDGDWSNSETLWNRSDDYASLEALFRETTDYVDDYDSDDYPGDWHNGISGDHFSVARLSELDRSYHDDWANSNVTGDGSELNSTEVQYLARDIGTWAVEQSAMLMRYFYDDLGQIPPTPSNVQIDGMTTSSITLTWDSITNADGYVVFRSGESGGVYNRVATTPNPTHHDTGLAVDTAYYYRVFAYNDVAGLGSGYASAAGTTLLPLLGDANGDGVVSAADYSSVQANFGSIGAAYIPGDANGDGVVSAGDYSSVQTNFGNTSYSAMNSVELSSFAVEPVKAEASVVTASLPLISVMTLSSSGEGGIFASQSVKLEISPASIIPIGKGPQKDANSQFTLFSNGIVRQFNLALQPVIQLGELGNSNILDVFNNDIFETWSPLDTLEIL